jgi:hypothetical protein
MVVLRLIHISLSESTSDYTTLIPVRYRNFYFIFLFSSSLLGAIIVIHDTGGAVLICKCEAGIFES